MSTDSFERVPPHDVQAEQVTLGAMLTSPDVAAECLTLLGRSTEFYRPAHQIVFEAIAGLADAGNPTDAVAVANEIMRRGEIGRIGGAPYLHTLIASVPTAANGPYYARIVIGKAILRRMVENGTRIVQLGYSQDGDPYDLAGRAVSEAEAIAPPRADENARPACEVFADAMDHLERQEWGLPLPWRDLNDLLCGLHPGQLVVLAARPGIGKSVLAAQLAAYCAVRLHQRALLCSLEMSARMIMHRMIATQAAVDMQSLNSGRLDDRDWDRIKRAYDKFTDAPLVIDDTSMCSNAHIRGRLRAMERERQPAKLLVVDYLQLMAGPGGDGENRTQFVGALSTGLKRIAREFKIPVVVVASLNRNSEHRADKVPQMSDLRDSGQVESDADVVILLHREDAHDPTSPRSGELDVIVAKNRNGPTGKLTLAWQGYFGRAVDMANVSPSDHDQSRYDHDWGSGFGPYRSGGSW